MHVRRGSVAALASLGSLLLTAALVQALAPPRAMALQTSSAIDAMKDYEDAIRKADAFYEAGNYFEAVLSLERAVRVAYNNKLTTDRATLEQKLARARAARDGKVTAGQTAPRPPAANGAGPERVPPAASGAGRAGTSSTGVPSAAGFIELTTLFDKAPRTITGRDVPQDNSQHHGPHGPDSRWVVSNPYLPLDRHFLPYVWRMACTADGTLYLGGKSVVPAAETKRQPRSNLDWYADNGSGVWKVAPDGKVTPFAVRAYGNQPGWDVQTGKCDVPVPQAGIAPDHWGGMAVDSQGDVLFSDSDLHVILKMRKDGVVEHVAGGGDQACAYDRYKTPQKSGYRDGTGTQALFNGPRGLAFDHDGNLLVADEDNCALRKIDGHRNVTTVYKGTCRFEQERLQVEYVAVDRDGLPIIGGSHARMGVEIYAGVYRVHPDGTLEQLLAGRQISPRTPRQYVGLLSGLDLLPNGSLIISDGFEGDPGNRLLDVRAGGVTGFLGVPNTDAMPEVDGPAGQARLYAPGNLCSSADGTIFILPKHWLRPIRKVDPRTKTVTSWIY